MNFKAGPLNYLQGFDVGIDATNWETMSGFIVQDNKGGSGGNGAQPIDPPSPILLIDDNVRRLGR